jgi:hypothetical protein
MLIFASSDKGGTGRTVTTCNLAHQLSLMGKNVAYLDFDFGSPTAGAIFEIDDLERGAQYGGLHSHLIKGAAWLPFDVRRQTARNALRIQPPGSGRLVLVPGDRGGGEFSVTREGIDRTTALLTEMEAEYHACVIDLSSGRSAAVQMVLHALADPALAGARVRWLLFHRWTRQHVLAAGGLLFDPQGIREYAGIAGHDIDTFMHRVRTIRTAVPDLKSPDSASTGAQASWLQECDQQLDDLARDHRLGPGIMLGSTPMEPMLQWREQLILASDVAQGFANTATLEAFVRLARDLEDNRHWEALGE